MGFADGYAYLVTGESSLAELNARLLAKGHSALPMNRFRPNIVIEGVEAHDEDRIGLLRIATGDGPIVLRPVKPCARCPIPNIDPATAHSQPIVGDTLQGYRRSERLKGSVTFGMNVITVNMQAPVRSVASALKCGS